jgi:hypothetical protein
VLLPFLRCLFGLSNFFPIGGKEQGSGVSGCRFSPFTPIEALQTLFKYFSTLGSLLYIHADYVDLPGITSEIVFSLHQLICICLHGKNVFVNISTCVI